MIINECNQKAVVIVGPTGVGKTELALKLMSNIFEIVSCDSVQVYKYLNIGSGKPNEETLKNFPHHLIDVVNPDEEYSAGDFVRDAVDISKNIAKKGKIPLFVGGTGMYIDSLFKGISEIPKISSEIRQFVKNELEIYGSELLYSKLEKIDPEYAIKIHCKDKQRIIRALEVYKATGKPFSFFHSKPGVTENFEALFIGLMCERPELVNLINKRVDTMIDNGLIDEVENLRKMGYGPSLKSQMTIGYKEIHSYLDGKIDKDSAIEEIKSKTRKYAKRQMVWFRKNNSINWFYLRDFQKINDKIKDFIE